MHESRLRICFIIQVSAEPIGPDTFKSQFLFVPNLMYVVDTDYTNDSKHSQLQMSKISARVDVHDYCTSVTLQA